MGVELRSVSASDRPILFVPPWGCRGRQGGCKQAGALGWAVTVAPCRFKGIKKGGVTENTSYYIFTQCPDGAFEAFPVHNWYNFTPLARHRTLTAEEAEEEWER